MSKKRVGIKYCGGCNPSYERVEMVERVRSSMKDRFLFLPHDQQDLDALVLINGCPRTCAEKGFSRIQIPFRSIIGETEFESLIDWLRTIDGKGNLW